MGTVKFCHSQREHYHTVYKMVLFSFHKEVPGEVLDLISRTFDAMGGRDWQEFIQGLGINLGEFDKIRLLPGEVESSERMYPDLRTRLPYLLFNIFQERCFRYGVNVDIIEIIVDTCRNPLVWGSEATYNKLARQIQEATGLPAINR